MVCLKKGMWKNVTCSEKECGRLHVNKDAVEVWQVVWQAKAKALPLARRKMTWQMDNWKLIGLKYEVEALPLARRKMTWQTWQLKAGVKAGVINWMLIAVIGLL